MTEDYENCLPDPAGEIQALRCLGYELGSAIADIVDNSISAGAKNIWISYDWNQADSSISITDDGRGMSQDELKIAMKIGGKKASQERGEEDLGRFGLGLKTASFSQGKILTVKTKRSNRNSHVRTWDLDYVEENGWKLSKLPPKGIEKCLLKLDSLETGTVVVWKKIDRVVEIEDDRDVFYHKMNHLKEHLGMVFHRFISAGPNSLNIFLGKEKIEAWDPFLKSSKFTLKLEESFLHVGKGTVHVKPYVIPAKDNRKKDNIAENTAEGPDGWDAHQGFFIYRNRRMIVAGGYLDFEGIKVHQNYSLARIQVDIPNSMDSEWKLDIRKEVAIPPDSIRKNLINIVKVTRTRASKVYISRIPGKGRKINTKNEQPVWDRRLKKGKIGYSINKNNPVIKDCIENIKAKPEVIKKMFHAIESTVPARMIIQDDAEISDYYQDNISTSLKDPPKELIQDCIKNYNHFRRTVEHDKAVQLTLMVEPFNTNVTYLTTLEALEDDVNE